MKCYLFWLTNLYLVWGKRRVGRDIVLTLTVQIFLNQYFSMNGRKYLERNLGHLLTDLLERGLDIIGQFLFITILQYTSLTLPVTAPNSRKFSTNKVWCQTVRNGTFYSLRGIFMIHQFPAKMINVKNDFFPGPLTSPGEVQYLKFPDL